MKVVLLANHSIKNAGDHAIMLESLRLIQCTWPAAHVSLVFNDYASARETYPDAHIIPSILAQALRYSPDGSYQLLSRSSRLLLILEVLGRTLLQRLGVRASPSQRTALLNALADANIVLACGGGYLRSDPDELFGWFTLTLLPFVITILLGKPLVLLPQSVGPLLNIRQRLPVQWLLKRTTLTVLRERISLRYLASLGIHERIIVGPDLAFGMPQTETLTRDQLCQIAGLPAQDGLLIGVTMIDWARQSSTFSAQQHYEDALGRALDTLTAQGAQLILFAQCYGPTPAEHDGLVAQRLRARAAHPERIGLMPQIGPATLQAAYGALDLLIGTRMHSVILATNAGTRSIAIAYQPKTPGVLAEIGIQQRGLDSTTLTAEQIVERVAAVLAEPSDQQTADYVRQAQEFKSILANLIRRLAL